MSWKVETLMSAREEFIALANSGAVSMSELCGRFNISRKTGYKWLRRYASGGAQSLHDRSHRTHTCPHRTRPAMEERIIALRLAHPTKGAHVLRRMLQNQGVTDVPAKSTIHAVLTRHGLIDPAQSAKHTPQIRFEHPQPNALWQMDFKGHFVMQQNRCHPLTLLDDHARFNLALQACA
ncbi:MAG: helix-turn-helix domain-containing protein, partial [Chloroflexi bacterium]|nr:helix-turn-helix domain-containing protein [Chloroflexota bacterium]